MSYRKIQLSQKTLRTVAEALFLAYRLDQVAYLAKISDRTLDRLKGTEQWREVERQRAEFEKPYRKKIYRGEAGWQGAAWMLERAYPGHLSKPELQLQLNTGNTTNNTLVITAEQSTQLRARSSTLEAQIANLKPHKPDVVSSGVGQETEQAGDQPPEPILTVKESDSASETISPAVVSSEGTPPPATAGGTPYTRAAYSEPNLSQNSKNLENLNPDITDLNSVDLPKVRRGKKASLEAKRATKLAKVRKISADIVSTREEIVLKGKRGIRGVKPSSAARSKKVRA